MPTMASVEAASRDSVCEAIAEQLQPLLQLHRQIRDAVPPMVDLERAAERVRAEQAAFDPIHVLRTAGELELRFTLAVKAFERAGEVPTAVASALRKRPWNARSLANSWVAGERLASDAVRRLAVRAAGLVASAVLRSAAESVIAVQPLDSWRRPICPCCGGTPDIAVVAGDARTLICSRCDTRWNWSRGGCPTCGARRAPALAEIRSPLLGYTLVICNPCGRYLKERRGSDMGDPMVERALTAELDSAAESRGLRV